MANYRKRYTNRQVGNSCGMCKYHKFLGNSKGALKYSVARRLQAEE